MSRGDGSDKQRAALTAQMRRINRMLATPLVQELEDDPGLSPLRVGDDSKSPKHLAVDVQVSRYAADDDRDDRPPTVPAIRSVWRVIPEVR